MTGSGAGCGQHWPTCNGDLLHIPQRVETLIEISHRLTSGLALVSAIALFVWARRLFSKEHLASRAATWVLALMLVECLIGAALVLGRWVAHDTSMARAVVMPLHLASASLLCAAFCVSAWSSVRDANLRFIDGPHWPQARRALLCVLILMMTGAVTALGDTLFPLAQGTPFAGRVGAEGLHFLQTLRVLHPILAVVLSALIFRACASMAECNRRAETQAWAWRARVLVLVQLAVGSLNIVLGAPAWIQVVHLALALGVWLLVVLTAVSCCTTADALPFEPQPS